MVIGTALGFSNLATMVLAISLAFLFGYTLTSIPLLRSGMTLAAVFPIALAADTVSIVIMEGIDNAFILAVPGAMDLVWGTRCSGPLCSEASPWRSARHSSSTGRTSGVGRAAVRERA